MLINRDDSMWALVMFDLPVHSKTQRARASKFRNDLLDLGFQRVQLSVYTQYFPAGARSVPVVKAVKRQLPPEGEVRIVMITDNQWSKAFRFYAQRQEPSEKEPPQLVIF